MIKFSISFCILSLICSYAFCQDPEKWQALEFHSAEDYRNQQPIVLECSNYVLSVPADASNPARKSAMGVIVKWMTGTPNFTFTIDESVAKLMNENEAVLSVYMATLTKNAIEHLDEYKDIKEFKLHSFDMLLTYCEDIKNNIEHTRELKRAIKAQKKGQLKEYLGV